jgi:hypothetical protein
VADVAVLHSFASREVHPSAVIPSETLFEQVLIQKHIPFEIIFDQHLENLSRYKVLVLAAQDALSDAQIGKIRAFVRAGGGLVATADVATVDDWRRRRDASGLVDLIGTAPSHRARHGRGRVAYVSSVVPHGKFPEERLSYSFPNAYWYLPRNTEALTSAVVWAAGGQLSATVTAPPSVTLELAERPESKSLLLHLVNYDFRHPVTGIDAEVQLPHGTRVREVVSSTPDAGHEVKLEHATAGGRVKFRIPKLEVYNLAVVRLD